MDEVERQQIIEQNLNNIVIIIWGALLFFLFMIDKLQFLWEVSVVIIFVRLMWKTGINIYRMKNPIITSTPHEKPYPLEILILRLRYFKLKQSILIVLLMLSLTGVGLHNSNSDYFHSRYLDVTPRSVSNLLVWSPSGDHLVSAETTGIFSLDKYYNLVIWDSEKLTIEDVSDTFLFHSTLTSQQPYVPNGKWNMEETYFATSITGTVDKNVVVWNFNDMSVSNSMLVEEDYTGSLGWLDNENLLIRDGSDFINWNMSINSSYVLFSLSNITTFKDYTINKLNIFDVSPDEKYVAIGVNDDLIIWDIVPNQIKYLQENVSLGRILDLSWSKNSDRIMLSSEIELSIWALETQSLSVSISLQFENYVEKRSWNFDDSLIVLHERNEKNVIQFRDANSLDLKIKKEVTIGSKFTLGWAQHPFKNQGVIFEFLEGSLKRLVRVDMNDGLTSESYPSMLLRMAKLVIYVLISVTVLVWYLLRKRLRRDVASVKITK